jgi:hypothetical protein
MFPARASDVLSEFRLSLSRSPLEKLIEYRSAIRFKGPATNVRYDSSNCFILHPDGIEDIYGMV